MKVVVDSKQMKAIDSYTIDTIGIPAIVLMERAALSVADVVKKHAIEKDRILVVCGIGNNGADGIATARILHLEGYSVDILMVGDQSKLSSLVNKQLNIAENLGIAIYNNISMISYTIIVDALFGIGLNKPVTGVYETIINDMNLGEHTIFSVDIPSGLSADTGKALSVAVKANHTITFGFNKVGMVIYPGVEYAGEVTVADIGFPDIALQEVDTSYFIYDSSDLSKLPIRINNSNKGTYGKVLVIAGSKDMSGACYFSSNASYLSGAGLVKVITEKENKMTIQTLLPEAILTTYDSMNLDEKMVNEIIKDIMWSSVIVIGPGLGINFASEQLFDLVIKHASVPIIIDADGINIIANRYNDQSVLNMNPIEFISSILPRETILTPHIKELSRLIDKAVDEIKNNILHVSNECTFNNNLIFALKDARSIVAYKNTRYINLSGNNGMSTGGSGDVLTGIIAGLIAQGMTPGEATVLGVYVHGLAGDEAAANKGYYSLKASDILDFLPKVLKN
jgi:NAD(P)H-hydrate epimerase